MIIILSILLGFVVLFIVHANYVYWRDRRRMTPEQRAQDDAETRAELQIW